MALNILDMIIGFLLVGLFAVALVNFGVQFSADNNTNQSIADSPEISNLATNLSFQLNETVPTNIENSRLSFLKNIPIAGDLGLVLISIVGVGSKVIGLTKGLAEVIFSSIMVTLGIEAIVVTTIIIIIVIILLFKAWSVYRSGQ